MRSLLCRSALLSLGPLLALLALSASSQARPVPPQGMRMMGSMPQQGMRMGSMQPAFNQAIFNAAMMGRGFGFMPPFPMSFGYGSPASSYGGGYGGSYGNRGAGYGSGSSSYGGGGGYSGNSSSSYGNPYQSGNYANPYGDSSSGGAGSYNLQTRNVETGHVLDAMGVPNTDGRLDWPLGLRILAPGEKAGELRKQIDALLQMAATQSGDGKVKPQVLQEASNAVDELHSLLRKKKDAFEAPYTYQEADRFLDKLAKGLKLLQ